MAKYIECNICKHPATGEPLLIAKSYFSTHNKCQKHLEGLKIIQDEAERIRQEEEKEKIRIEQEKYKEQIEKETLNIEYIKFLAFYSKLHCDYVNNNNYGCGDLGLKRYCDDVVHGTVKRNPKETEHRNV